MTRPPGTPGRAFLFSGIAIPEQLQRGTSNRGARRQDGPRIAPLAGAQAKRKRPRRRPTTKDKEPSLKPKDDGASPVDIIIGMMRGDLPFDDARFKAAVAAAPYVHARRGTAEPAEESNVRHEDALKELE